MLSCVGVLVLMSGCFYYDSRWGQEKKEQERAAERLTPAKLERKRGPSGAAAHDVYVRAYATPGYAAETMSWEQRYEELLRDASAILGAELGVRLVNGGTGIWKPTTHEDSFDALLTELAALDSGDGAGWIVGFVESTPKLVTDYHKLGAAQLFSKYLVVRASNDPAELDALARSLDELDEAERARVYAERKRHKTVTVFLHEIAHALGALHRTDSGVIMHPTYDPKVRGYAPATIRLLRIMVPYRLEGAADAKQYRSLLEFYQADSTGWVERERDGLIRRMEATVSPKPAAPDPVAASVAPTAASGAAGSASVEQGEVLGLDSLDPEDRARFDEATASVSAGEVAQAWRLLQPVFAAHPRVREVQDLRCRMAKEQEFMDVIVQAHCAAIEALGPGRGLDGGS